MTMVVMNGPVLFRLAGLLALLCACGQPGRLVIDDDPELVDATMTALTDLEAEAGCKLFKRIDIGGRSKDWRGNYPPIGTVTVDVKPGALPGWHAGRDPETGDIIGIAESSKWKGRSRVHLESADVGRAAIAHELGHALNIKHQDVDGELMSESGAYWVIGPKLMEQIRARCVDGPAGPTL